MKKTLYERRKGKEFAASGSWELNRKEDVTIKVLGVIFAMHVILALITTLLKTDSSVFFFVMAFVWMFIMMGYMFYLVFKKQKEEPIEAHYYDVDYKYNGIKGEIVDNTKEISAEEFHHKKEEQDRNHL